MATVGLRKQTDALVMRFVVGELLEKRLSEMPHCNSSVLSAIGCLVAALRAHRAHEKGAVLLWHAVREVCRLNGAFCLTVRSEIHRDIGENIVAISNLFEKEPKVRNGWLLVVLKTHLVWLVDVEEVDLVVPRPLVECCSLRVVVWTTSAKKRSTLAGSA